MARLHLLCVLSLALAVCGQTASLRIPRFPSPRRSWYQNSAARVSSGGYQWKEAWFTQTLDHFSFRPHSYDTFQQKYIFWDDVWSGAAEGGPIFVYCGNEGPVEWFLDNAGWIREIAKEFGALVVGPEHRYYGASMPFNGSAAASYRDAQSRAFLTTEQALADMATLLTSLRTNLSAEHCPIVLFGGSYGGMLAAWFRLKYPHIAVGAVASSAPILQYADVVRPDTFNRIASSDFRRESESCFQTIRGSWELIRQRAKQPGGLAALGKQFRFCRPPADVEDLIDWLSDAYGSLAMVDYPIATSFLMPLPAYPIREVCRAVDGLPDGADPLDRVFAGVSVFYNFSGAETCFDPHADPHGESGWQFQACTEQVMPFASNASNSLFEPYDWDLQAFSDGCFETYGVRPRPSWVLTHFGGQNIKEALRRFASNIVFSNGALDPWSGGGVLESLAPSLVSLLIPDGAHHLDLRASTPADPPSVRWQRAEEQRHIRRWLAEHRAQRQGQGQGGRRAQGAQGTQQGDFLQTEGLAAS